MNVRAINNAEAQAAVCRIKNMASKNFDYGVSFKIPQEFIEKRRYMQSDEFIKDGHNVRMFNAIDNLMSYRDEIAIDVNNINRVLREKLVQAINGYARLTDDLKKDYSLNFDNHETLGTPSQIRYRQIKISLLPKLRETEGL